MKRACAVDSGCAGAERPKRVMLPAEASRIVYAHALAPRRGVSFISQRKEYQSIVKKP